MPYIFWGNRRSRKEAADTTGAQHLPDFPGRTKVDNNQPSSVDVKHPKKTGTTHNLEKSEIPCQNETAVNNSTSGQQQPPPPHSCWPPDDAISEKRIDHKPLTLDQYYYESLGDTYERDCDQVLSRLFDRALQEEEERAKERKAKASSHSDKKGIEPQGNTMQSHTEAREVKPPQILMVHQLWLWILDNGITQPLSSTSRYHITNRLLDIIITSTTEEDKEVQKTFLRRVLDNLHRTELGNINQNDKTTSSIHQIASLIMDTARDLFNVRDIAVYHDEDGKIAPLDGYRQAIQFMVRNIASSQ